MRYAEISKFMLTLETFTAVITLWYTIITMWYTFVTRKIFKANKEMVQEQIKNDKFTRTFEQIKRLEDRKFREIRKFILQEWDGNYPTQDEDKNEMIREFSHTMDTIGAAFIKEYLDKDFLIDLYGAFIIIGHRKTKRFVEYIKHSQNVKRYQDYFEKMAIDIESVYKGRYQDGWLDLPEGKIAD